MSDPFRQAGDDVDAPGSRTITIAGDEPWGSLRRTATAIQGLSPGYFPFVMASSIISTGTFLLGPSWLTRALLVIASAGCVVLIVAIVIQLVLFRPSVAASFRDPDRVFGLFAIAAGMNVLGLRLADAGHPLATGILARRGCRGVARTDLRGACQPARPIA